MDGVVPLTGSWKPLEAVRALRECSSDPTEMTELVGDAYDDWRNSIFSKWANEPLIGEGEDSMESRRYAYFDRFHGLNALCYQGRQMSYNPDTDALDEETPARGHLVRVALWVAVGFFWRPAHPPRLAPRPVWSLSIPASRSGRVTWPSATPWWTCAPMSTEVARVVEFLRYKPTLVMSGSRMLENPAKPWGYGSWAES